MRKDLQDIRKNGYVFYSLLFLPVILAGVSILGTLGYTLAFNSQSQNTSGIDPVLIFSSLFIMIPAVITTLVGSTSVILEKNNHSLEPLLATPLTDMELFAGKALAPFVPGVLISWLAYAIYIVLTDTLTFGHLGYFLFPTELMLLQMFFLTPVVGLLGTFAALFVSSRMKDVRAAQQVSSLVVLPVLILVYIPIFAAGVDLLVNLILGVILLGVALVLFFVSVKAFSRESILISWGR